MAEATCQRRVSGRKDSLSCLSDKPKANVWEEGLTIMPEATSQRRTSGRKESLSCLRRQVKGERLGGRTQYHGGGDKSKENVWEEGLSIMAEATSQRITSGRKDSVSWLRRQEAILAGKKESTCSHRLVHQSCSLIEDLITWRNDILPQHKKLQ